MTETSERTSEFVRELGEAVRKNPISAALIGMGVVWLFAGRHASNPLERISGVADAAQDVWRGAASNIQNGSEKAQGRVSAATATLRDQSTRLVEGVSERGGELAESITEYAGSGADFAGNVLDNVRSNLGELFRSQPLALGAVGLAIGGAIAASLPVTDAEAAYLGETSDFVKQKASEIASEKAHDVVDLGGKVLDAVADEARQQGLTADGLKSTAGEMAEKISRVAAGSLAISNDPRGQGR
jgi:hypothetical protein